MNLFITLSSLHVLAIITSVFLFWIFLTLTNSKRKFLQTAIFMVAISFIVVSCNAITNPAILPKNSIGRNAQDIPDVLRDTKGTPGD